MVNEMTEEIQNGSGDPENSIKWGTDKNPDKKVEEKSKAIATTEKYESKREWYLEKYAGDVDPPNPDLKVSIVVPAFAELDSDNFWRLFRSLMYQRGVKQSEFEVIYVVNNSEEIAVEDGNELFEDDFEGRTSEKRKSRYGENQRHLLILRTIKEGKSIIRDGGSLPEVFKKIKIQLADLSLSEFELSLVSRYLESNVNLQFVDASSPGKGFGKDKNVSPIGLARDIGAYIAYDRYKKLGRDGLIDFVDGDGFLDPYYVDGLLDSVESGAKVIVKPLRKVVAEIPRQIEETTDRKIKISSAIRYLASVYTGTDYFGKVVKDYDRVNKKFDVNEILGGPQIALLSSALCDVDGYSVESKDEDWCFSGTVTEVFNETEIETLNGSSVLMSDRGRDVSFDGRYRGQLVGSEAENVGRDRELEEYTNLRLRRLRESDTNLRSAMMDISFEHNESGEFSYRTMMDEYEGIKQKLFEQVSKNRLALIEKIGHWLEKVVVLDMDNLSERQIVDEYCKRYKPRRVDRDFFEQNSVLISLVTEVLKDAKAGQGGTGDVVMVAMEKLKTLLPEYFEIPPTDMPPVSKTEGNENVANYSYVFEAVYIMKSRLRKKLRGSV